MTNINVNTRIIDWGNRTINYQSIVQLAMDTDMTCNTMFTVQYSRGPESNSQGTLIDGQSIEVTEGMVFTVSNTSNA